MGRMPSWSSAAGAIFATHFPHYGRGMACTGDYDLVCCGRSHVAEIIRQPNIRGGQTLLVNPGSVSGIARQMQQISDRKK